MNSENDRAAELAERYNVSRESLARLRKYVELLLIWQQRMNLIGPATIDSIWERHIHDSLQLLPLLPKGTIAIAELGSGAGIPGLVVAIAANLEAHLYDSNSKKSAFLREAIRTTGANAKVHNIRLEALKTEAHLPAVQCVLARALAPLPLLLDNAEPFLRTGATGLFHNGQDVELELTEATKYWRLQLSKHQSAVDSRGVILDVKEAARV